MVFYHSVQLRELIFQRDSELIEIRNRACGKLNLSSLCLPRKLARIAGDAFCESVINEVKLQAGNPAIVFVNELCIRFAVQRWFVFAGRRRKS
jgi:hypothetical protein